MTVTLLKTCPKKQHVSELQTEKLYTCYNYGIGKHFYFPGLLGNLFQPLQDAISKTIYPILAFLYRMVARSSDLTRIGPHS